jgi:hypothetical protein
VLVLANSTLTVQGTKFTNNTVQKGALYGSWLSRLVVQQAVFVNNTAAEEGGAMYLVGSDGTVLGSKCNTNVAEKGGGAAYVKFSSLCINSTEFFNNTAPVGGAIAVYNTSQVSLTNSSLLNNTTRPVKAVALGDPSSSGGCYTLGVGGALYVERSSVDIDHSKAWGNRAVMDGGEFGHTQSVHHAGPQPDSLCCTLAVCVEPVLSSKLH